MESISQFIKGCQSRIKTAKTCKHRKKVFAGLIHGKKLLMFFSGRTFRFNIFFHSPISPFFRPKTLSELFAERRNFKSPLLKQRAKAVLIFVPGLFISESKQ